MNRLIAPLFVALFVLIALTAALPANTTDDLVYNCEGITYPDGTEGSAVVTVILSGSEAPTVMVTVDYYNADYSRYLGKFEDWSGTSDFPSNQDEAEEYAIKHYNDRR